MKRFVGILAGFALLAIADPVQVKAEVEIIIEDNSTRRAGVRRNETKKRMQNGNLLWHAKQSKSEELWDRVFAYVHAGFIYYTGIHEYVDRKRAMQYFLEAERIRIEEIKDKTRPNTHKTNMLIAHAYETGNGLKQNKDLALKHIRRYAYPDHQDKSYEEILQIMARSQGAAATILADRIRGTGDTKEEIAKNNEIAFEMYSRGRPENIAQTNTAEMLWNGEGTPRDPVRAYDLLNIVTRTKPTRKALLLYADILYQGAEGVPKDRREAQINYRQAAWLGVVRAGRTAGLLYYPPDEGNILNYNKGLQWLEWAGERGDLIAQVEASSKWEGIEAEEPTRSDPKTPFRAYAWMKTASHHPDAPKALMVRAKQLKNQLKPSEVALGEAEHLRQMNAIRYHLANPVNTKG